MTFPEFCALLAECRIHELMCRRGWIRGFNAGYRRCYEFEGMDFFATLAVAGKGYHEGLEEGWLQGHADARGVRR